MDFRKDIKQFVLYLIVGGGATVVEWLAFFLITSYCKVEYLFATAIAFIFSTFANWIFGKLLLFREKQNIAGELLKVYAVSIAGLLMNLLIMWIAVEKIKIGKMISKIIATGIVFMWNFMVRKLVIYKI